MAFMMAIILVILALCRDLFEKLTIAQLVMDVPAFSVT
jgi:hypothetical protein